MLITEGATDVAGIWDMGFRHVVGRPSCTGGVKLLLDLVRDRQPTAVVIVADGDEPGRRGAQNLASVLATYSASVRVIRPPEGIKDARAWLRAGGRRCDLEAAISAATAEHVTMITRKVR
jgi:DNA primase